MTDLEWAIGINRLLLKTVGLWPPDNQNARTVVRSKFLLLCNLIWLTFIYMIPIFLSLIRVWGDMILIIDNLQYSLTTIITIFKACVVWYKQKGITCTAKYFSSVHCLIFYSINKIRKTSYRDSNA